MKPSGRRLRSGKTLTNKTLNNSINKSKRKSGATKENKKVATRTVRSTSTKSRSTKAEKTKDTEKKENVSRINRENTNRTRSTRCTVLSSKKKVNIPEGTKLKNKTSFRQMSLKESFSNQETLSKRLRPRKESRNYCEDSVLQQNNKNSVNKPNEGKNSKVPVYKSVKLNEESLKNDSDIYDFKFDANDSKERLSARRRRRIINRVKQKRMKKTTYAKPKQVPPMVKEKVSSDVPKGNIVKKAKGEKERVPGSSADTGKKSEDDTKKEHVQVSSSDINSAETETSNEPSSAETNNKGIESNNVPSSAESNDTGIESNNAASSAETKDTAIESDNASSSSETKDTAIESDNALSAESRDTAIECDNAPSSAETKDTAVESDNVPKLETNQQPSTKVISENTEKQLNTMSKPKIVSIENLDKNKVLIETPVKSNAEHFAPFRKTNIFNNKGLSQYGNMMNHSLINKSFSPINKVSENFDPGSPWRISPINTFSQVTNLFQSTPQPRAVEILQGKIIRNAKDQAKRLFDTTRKSDIIEADNENLSAQKTLDRPNYITRKFGQSARKFGTEITNLDHSVQSTNTTNNITLTEQYEGAINNNALRNPNINLQSTINIMPNDTPTYNDTTEDKENAVPKSSKTKKLLRKRLKKIASTSSSPLKKEKGIQDKENLNAQSEPANVQTFSPSSSYAPKEKEEQSTEIFEPQPGPSGLQKFKSPSNKPLQQTNLNAFLNIPEVPQSTTITTAHGIYDDAHSTPISGKPIKSIKPIDTKHMEIDNAFGFKDDSSDSNLDISPIYPDPESNDVQNKKVLETHVPQTRKNSALPARLLAQEIKKTIAQENVDNRENDAKNANKENIEVGKPLSSEKSKNVDTTDFSDTFDVLEEKENDETQKEQSDIPLFTDLEPVHFTQPPKRSYKRKRNVKFSFSESSSEENESDDTAEPERKKKKRGKLNKEDVKRMRDWIKNINETFQEIEHYELVVE